MSNFINMIALLGGYFVDNIFVLSRSFAMLVRIVKSSLYCIYRPRFLINQVYFSGVLSLPIILLSGMFIGMVLSFQSYHSLHPFGVSSSSSTLVAIVMTRELSPVVSAILFASRAGSAITAGISLMHAKDEISALEAMGIDSYARCFAPRFWGQIISLPILCLIFSVVGLFGAYLVLVSMIGIDPYIFWGNIVKYVDFKSDLLLGLFKSLVFAVLIALVSIYQGNNSDTSIDGISMATTKSVVVSSVLVLFIDFLITSITN